MYVKNFVFPVVYDRHDMAWPRGFRSYSLLLLTNALVAAAEVMHEYFS
jgi:hypothetical protein